MSDSSDLSDLSPVPSDDESNLKLERKDGILRFFSKVTPSTTSNGREDSPPRPKRDPSPPHEHVLADNSDIALKVPKLTPTRSQFIVMFRSRFAEAFPKSLANFGPQEIERGVVDIVPGENIEHLLCALLGLLLNRKQDVKRGHYNRALEEAIQTHKSQWLRSWEKNPVSGSATFESMTPVERLTLLRTLIIWTLSSSDSIKGLINGSYKHPRHEDDLTQPYSVQPWGWDSDKRRYYLIEGLDDTNFRIYRETNPTGLKRDWISVAGEIDDLKALAEKLKTEDGGPKAKTLSGKILQAIPRFEATEEKRKRREYRQVRKQQFKRPELSYSLYEGRTRGKRMKYTFSDDEDDDGYSDSTSRRSTRNTGSHTPAEPAGPTITASGRQVKSRFGGAYGESLLSGQQAHTAPVGGLDGAADGREDDDDNDADVVVAQPRRGSATKGTARQAQKSSGGRHIDGYNSVDEMDDEDEASEEEEEEEDYGDDDEDDVHMSVTSDKDVTSDLSDDDGDDDELEDGDEHDDDDMNLDTNAGVADAGDKKTLVVKLSVKTPTPEKTKSSGIATITTAEREGVEAGQHDKTKPVEAFAAAAATQGDSAVSVPSEKAGADLKKSDDDDDDDDDKTTAATAVYDVSASSAGAPVLAAANLVPATASAPAPAVPVPVAAARPQQSPPASPSLAFRGSSEKAQQQQQQSFAAPIKVGLGGP